MADKRPCNVCPVGGKWNEADYTCSVPDPVDGLPVTCVGDWAEDKHKRVVSYVDISRSPRRKFVNQAGATFIDLYSGPGRSRVMKTLRLIDGSALAAGTTAIASGTGFTSIHLGDLNPTFLEASRARLEAAGVPTRTYVGPAHETVVEVCTQLTRGSLNVAFLDPYDLASLPFSIVEVLSKEKRMDIITHISLHDLQRNLERYITSSESPLDNFAPGWRKSIDYERQTPEQMRLSILNHWRASFRSLGMTAAEGVEKVTGSKGQNLYWLAFAAAHELANKFWEAIRDTDPQRNLI